MKEIKGHKKVARFDNKIVEKNLLKFEQKLTINQQKVLYYLIIQEKNANSLQGITWNELQDLIGVSSGEKYELKRKKKFLQDVQKAQLGIVIDEKNMEFHTIFPSIGLRYNKFYYTINPEITSLFNQPSLDYYLNNYEMIQHFKHDYSIKLFELLNKELGANDKKVHDFRYDIKELRLYLNLQDNEYKEVKDLRRWIIEPSLKEINELTDINIGGKYNAKTKKVQLSSKKRSEDVIYFRGISRKITVNEYVQEQFDNAVITKEEGRTKINKETKVSNEVCADETSIEVIKDVYGEFKHVQLSKEQYEQAQSLFANAVELNNAITLLDEYFEQMPEMVNKFNNHYISLKRFSKKIIDAQNAKAKQKGSYNYNNQSKDVYVEPTYEKFEKDDESRLTLEEIRALLEDPFGSNEDYEKESTEEVIEIITATYPENEEDKQIQEVDLSNDKKNLSVKEDFIEPTYQNDEGIVITAQDEQEIVVDYKISGDLLLEKREQLYRVAEHLYYSYHAGKINAETATIELIKRERMYQHELTHEEKIELNKRAKEKWEAIPF